MKVLYLDQSGQLGGGEIALLPWLCLQRDQASVLLFEDGPFRAKLEHAGVAVQIVRMAGVKQIRRGSGLRAVLYSLPALLRTRGELRRIARDYDTLYANSMKAVVVACLIRRWEQPVVWHLRDILSAEHFGKAMRMAAIAIGNICASAIIVNSEATAIAFVGAGGNRSKITVVYDGVSSADGESSTTAMSQRLRSDFVAPERLLVGVFSRLAPWKGQHVLLEAISRIPDVNLLIVGDALFGETDYAAALHVRASEPDLSGRVNFTGFRQDIAELMRCVDIVVHSSISAEPFGLVIVEGMLAGRPVIATRAGGAVEIIESGESGILVGPASVSDLHDAIVHLRDNPVEAKRVGSAGRVRAIDRFPLQSMFEGIGRVLQRFEPQSSPFSGETLDRRNPTNVPVASTPHPHTPKASG